MKKSKNTLYLCEFTLGLMAALLFLNLYLSRKIPASHAIHRLFQMTSVLSIVIIVLILIQREILSRLLVNAFRDITGLGLDTVQETDDEFVIGCMTPLRELEINKRLNEYTHGAVRESLRHIVGVQFRNCATIGGSIWGRYGFSDVLTMFLAMDTWVELYDAGRIPLTEFVNRKKDNDILVNIIVRKQPLFVCYMSQRNSKTDFPVLTCTASLIGEEARTVIGARPARAVVVEDKESILKNFKHMTNKQRTEAIEKFTEYAAEHVTTAGNMRASAEYRTLLVKILIRRTWEAVGGMKNEY